MLTPGLVSITFRQLGPDEIIRLVQKGGLQAIEWGGDVHVPHGQIERARSVGEMTRAAELTVASYGSYYRAGTEHEVPFPDVLATGVELGAPLIRIWAGRQGSADADLEYRHRVADDIRDSCDRAADAGLGVALEFHRNTLTDTADSTCALLKQVARENLSTYWQPPVNLPVDEQERELRKVLSYLSNLHVFHWPSETARGPLTDGVKIWERFVAITATAGAAERFAMIEFVRGDTPEQFLEDADALRRIVAAARPEKSSDAASA